MPTTQSSRIFVKPLVTALKRPTSKVEMLRLCAAMPHSATWLVPSWRRLSSIGFRSCTSRRSLHLRLPRARTTLLSTRRHSRHSSRRSLSSGRSPTSRMVTIQQPLTGSSRRCTSFTLNMPIFWLPTDNWPARRSTSAFSLPSSRAPTVRRLA